MTEFDEPPAMDPRGPELIYKQIADDIERKIRSGELPDGFRLPGTRDLAAEYGVAPLTARRAGRELAERGLVVIVHGKGTYVTSRA